MKKIAVVSGKGGVGKTTIALMITKTLAAKYNVALLDFDVTGSNSHMRVKIIEEHDIRGNTIYPAVAELDGKRFLYYSPALASDSYVLWDGKTVADFVRQVLSHIELNVDFCVIDSAPGTHSDTVECIRNSDVVVLVTIPADFAYLDLKRTVDLVARLEKPIAGVYINMAYIKCECGRIIRPFKYEHRIKDIPVIEEIPFGDISLDLDKLLHHLNNPVKIKPPEKETLIGKLLRKYLELKG